MYFPNYIEIARKIISVDPLPQSASIGFYLEYMRQNKKMQQIEDQVTVEVETEEIDETTLALLL